LFFGELCRTNTNAIKDGIATPFGLAMTTSLLLLIFAMRYAACFERPGGLFVKALGNGIPDSFQG